MNEITLVGTIAGIIAGLSILAVVVISIREKRRTGMLPQELRRDQSGWFAGYCIWCIWFWISLSPLDKYSHKFPVYVVKPSIDLAMFIAFLALAVFAYRWAFSSDWHWRTGLWISYISIFPALSSILVIKDIISLIDMPWIWIIAVLFALYMAPQFTRLAYEEFYLRRVNVFSNHSDISRDL
jgi:hypothetical protein